MNERESDDIKLHLIARKSSLDVTDVDFILNLLYSNVKLQYNYIKQFTKYKELTAEECSPRSLAKAIIDQQSTIDYLFSSHCKLEDGYMKRKHPKKQEKKEEENKKEDETNKEEKKKEENDQTFCLRSFKHE